MLVKFVAIAAVVALAVGIGVAYGTGGLIVLGFFLFWAAAVPAFLLAWGSIARRGGGWYYERQSSGRKLGD